MSEMVSILIVFLTGMLGIWKAVPVGFALNLHPVTIYLMTTLGAITTAVIIYFSAEWIRNRFFKKNKNSRKKRESRAQKLLEKYGIPGLGFLGCFLIGPNMTLLIGLVIVNSSKQLLWWVMAGIIFWSLVLTVVAALGIISLEGLKII